MNKHLTAIAIMLVTMLTAACTRNEHSAYANIDTAGWAYGDTLVFSTDAPVDTAADVPVRYDMSIVVRHNNNYRYSNLWLEARYVVDDSVHTDTLNIRLADEFGKWYGQGVGISYQLTQPVVSDIAVDLARDIRVSHIMRDDTLPDIEQIGVVLLPHTDNL